MAEKTLSCKYGCGTVFPETPTGRTDYMRHVQFDCPNNPKSKVYTPGADTERKVEAPPSGSDEFLDEQEILGKIIAETVNTVKQNAIVRMVGRHLGNKKESIETLSEALRLADIRPHSRNLILKNWAAHIDISDIESILESDKKEDEKKADEKKAEEDKKKPIDLLEEGVKQAYASELERLKVMQVRKQIRDMENEMSSGVKEGEEKQTMVVDGVSLKVTPQEMLSWKRYEADQKKEEEEREERKEERKQREEDRRNREEEQKTHKKDDLIEWVLGEGKEAKTIKVRPETIPMLIQSQQGKSGKSDELKEIRDEMKQMNEKHQQFQMEVMQKEMAELKMIAEQDPLDRILDNKNKLEQLGLVSDAKVSAQDKMYSMEGKKLDTMLGITSDKSKSLERKVDALVKVFGPLAENYVREAVITMRKQRGETAGEDVPRTEGQAEDALKSLEEVDKAMTETKTESTGPPKVVGVEKTEKGAASTKKER